MPDASAYVLGVSAFYHDSAVCLLRDGEIVAAAQEERFSRIKGDADFPRQAITFALEREGIGLSDVGQVAFYDKPLLKFERILETYLSVAPRGFRSFLKAGPVWMKDKLYIDRTIRKELDGFAGDVLYAEHHESHAASAFFPSPFESAAILTVDGVGEWATACMAVGAGNEITKIGEIQWPDSLGLLYSAFTYYLGFKVNSGEYKVMGLAPYGEPEYLDLILSELLDLRDDGSFRLDQRYFNYLSGLTMTSSAFDDLFGGPPRQPETLLTQRDMNLARSVQAACEEIMLRMSREVHRRTGLADLCLAGGVALNAVSNGRIQREGPFERVWIQPASGDAGGAIGAALLAWHRHVGQPRILPHPRHRIGRAVSAPESGAVSGGRAGISATAEGRSSGGRAGDSLTAEGPLVSGGSAGDSPTAETRDDKHDGLVDGMGGCLLGPEFTPDEITAALRPFGAVHSAPNPDDLPALVASLLAEGKVVGWFAGRMEFGPRALGARSILADPRNPAMQSQLNLKIKFREGFRPFAPGVLKERASEYFEMGDESPYMLIVAPLKDSHRLPMPDGTDRFQGIDRLKVARSDIPAVTHVDYSARVQTVGRGDNPPFRALLEEFESRTACPVLVNTSFNVRGEPIVCSPADAYRCFMRTNIDYLVLWPYLLDRTVQPAWKEGDDWQSQMTPD